MIHVGATDAFAGNSWNDDEHKMLIFSVMMIASKRNKNQNKIGIYAVSSLLKLVGFMCVCGSSGGGGGGDDGGNRSSCQNMT